jgi:uncharacterized membrane protein
MSRLVRLARRSPALLARHIAGLFLTGLLFLLPLLLTAIAIGWVLGQLGAVFGPGTFIGGLIAGLGQLASLGVAGRVAGFWLGLLLLIAGVTVLGGIIQAGARGLLETWVDGLLSRIPVVGKLYQPFAQLVRTMGGNSRDEMAAMAVVAVRFGDGAEVLALLASPESFDVGNGPSRLILIPTAPVPIGGALLFVPEANVRALPELRFDDMAKFYITMGTVAHPALLAGAIPVRSRP